MAHTTISVLEEMQLVPFITSLPTAWLVAAIGLIEQPNDNDSFVCFCSKCCPASQTRVQWRPIVVARRTAFRHKRHGLSSLITAGTTNKGQGVTIARTVEVLKLLRGHLRTMGDRRQPRFGTQPPSYPETDGYGDMGFPQPPPPDPPADVHYGEDLGLNETEVPFEDWHSGYFLDPELLKVIQEYHERPPKPTAELTNSIFPNDGGVEDDGLNKVNMEDLGEVKKPLVDFMNIIAGVAAKKHLTEDVVTSLLEAFSNSDGVFAAGMVAKMPTDAKNMFSYIVAEFSPKLIKYLLCRRCGNAKRFELRDSQACTCGKSWKRAVEIRVVNMIEWIRLLMAAPLIAEVMGWEDAERRMRPRDSEPALEIYDTPFWQELAQHNPNVMKDARFVKLALFLDGMLIRPRDTKSGSMKVWLVKLLNLPGHLRHLPGLTVPFCVVDAKRNKIKSKSYHGVHEIFADQVAFMKTVGFEVYDGHREESFTMHGDLVKLYMDSRAIQELVGRAEAGASLGSSLGTRTVAYSVPDVVKGKKRKRDETGDSPAWQKLTKVVIIDNWRELPTDGERYMVLRRAAASLNDRTAFSSDGLAGAWDATEPPADRWTHETLRDAYVLLDSIKNSDLTSREIKKRKTAAEGVGVRRATPFLRTGLNFKIGIKYDPAHTSSNAYKQVRCNQLEGGNLIASSNLLGHLEAEVKFNQRYQAARDMARITTDKEAIRTTLPYVFTPEERLLASRRGEVVLAQRLAHAAMKGENVFNAYNIPLPHQHGLQYLTIADCFLLSAPLGKWYIAGCRKTPFKVGDFESTYEQVAFDFLDALNLIRRKDLRRDEAEHAFMQVVVAVTQYYLAYPTFEQTHVIHQLVEVAKSLPAWFDACIAEERFMRTVRKNVHNYKTLGTTVMRAMQRFIGKFIGEMTKPGASDPSAAVTTAATMVGPEARVHRPSDVILLPAPNPAFYSSVAGGKTPVKLKVLKGKRGRKVLDNHPEIRASLIMYYLTSDEWHPANAKRLETLRSWYVDDGGDDPVGAVGCNAKCEAWIDFARWCKAEGSALSMHMDRAWYEARGARAGITAEDKSLVTLDERIRIGNRCEVGALKLRTAHLDNVSDVTTRDSYFLARVNGGEGEEWYEVGRSQRFISHRCPSTPAESEHYATFIEAKWLIPVTPWLTERSLLPMVVMDDTERSYLQNRDAQDQFITSLWPATGVEPLPVSILPLDAVHDVPPSIRPFCSSTTCRPSALGAYRRAAVSAPPGAGSVDPTSAPPQGFVRLGAVICPFSHMSMKFVRRIAVVNGPLGKVFRGALEIRAGFEPNAVVGLSNGNEVVQGLNMRMGRSYWMKFVDCYDDDGKDTVYSFEIAYERGQEGIKSLFTTRPEMMHAITKTMAAYPNVEERVVRYSLGVLNGMGDEELRHAMMSILHYGATIESGLRDHLLKTYINTGTQGRNY